MKEYVVQVNEGLLRGKVSVNYRNGQFYSFFGIPYALPPLGKLRFQPPQPPSKWNGIRDARFELEGCISRNTFTQEIEGNEDCLFLNVFSSMVDSRTATSKPVMVWIHGGAFQNGSTKTDLYGPEYLMTQDIVLVTVSYRLGALGFLCLEDTSLGVTGNNAFRDIIMALKWIQKNIQSFMGDPQNVTLFGESSGGVSIHYLMLSPLAMGLFHKIILQSGCALHHWAEGARDSASRMAKILGLSSNNDRDILAFLQQQPIRILYDAQEKVKVPISPHIKRHFCPVLEKISPLIPPVISKSPLDVIRSGDYNKMPMMIGYNSDEGIFFEYKISKIVKSNAPNSLLVTNFENLIPHDLNIPVGTPLSHYISNEIRSFYFNDDEPTLKYKTAYYQVYADVFFNHRLSNAATIHRENLGHPIYCFRFSVDGKFNVYKKLHGSDSPGASHSDDVCYLFKVGSQINDIIRNSFEDITIQRMVKLWTNFAKYGNPNGCGSDANIPVDWKPIDVEKIYCLDIGKELSICINPEYDRVKFWDKIYRIKSFNGKL
ncbi:hypothetical protein Trydic_g15496 [Trypoxylus dichotomus]